MQEEWSVLIAALNHTLCHTVYLSKLSQNPFCTLVFMKIRIDVSQSVQHGIIYKYISPIRQFGSRFTAADSHICNGWLCCSSYEPYEQITRFSEAAFRCTHTYISLTFLVHQRNMCGDLVIILRQLQHVLSHQLSYWIYEFQVILIQS